MSDVIVSTVADIVDVNDLGVRRRGQRRRVITKPVGETMTKQADRDRADIHKILARFQKTGLMPQRIASPLPEGMPVVDDFMQAQNFVVQVHNYFDGLPVKLRQRFGHNPSEFLAFASDPENDAEMRKLGLRKPVELPAVEPVAPPKEQAKGETAPAGGGQ